MRDLRRAGPSPAHAQGAEKPACVLCGRCLSACPLFAVTGREELSPRAKFHLLQTLAAKRDSLDEKSALDLAGLCLSCGKCEQACPFGLCAPDRLSQLRAAHPGLESRLWKLWVEGAGALWPVMTSLARLSPRFSLPGRLGEYAAGLQAMDKRGALTPWLTPTRFAPCGQGRKAVLFPGCVGTHVRPDWTRTAAALLTGLGFALLPAPAFTCCGCTLEHAGLLDARDEMRRANIAAWRAAGRPLVVTFCATCRCGLRSYAKAPLDWEPGEADAWLTALTPLSGPARFVEFAWSADAPDRVLYHTPCHGAQGGHDRDFLAAVLGERLSARTKKSLCCGFGGALKLSAPELSARVAADCLKFHDPKPGEPLLTGCSGCVIQLRSHAAHGVSVGHWLEAINA
ncbi:(Fe-S)-binding protein [Fundidesulfovibrio butyratiphilus]